MAERCRLPHAGKESTQEEFFHTVNEFMSSDNTDTEDAGKKEKERTKPLRRHARPDRSDLAAKVVAVSDFVHDHLQVAGRAPTLRAVSVAAAVSDFAVMKIDCLRLR